MALTSGANQADEVGAGVRLREIEGAVDRQVAVLVRRVELPAHRLRRDLPIQAFIT